MNNISLMTLLTLLLIQGATVAANAQRVPSDEKPSESELITNHEER